jgi:multidrug resistance efflux pump
MSRVAGPLSGWRIRVLIALAAAAIVAAAALFGYRLWYNSTHFVSTNNAQVTAALVQAGSINAGRIISMNIDVGMPVSQGQVIAVVDIPTVISKSDTTDTSKLGFRDVQDQLVDVVAPISGVVAARWARVGDTMPEGQPIVTLMDPKQTWITANIDERDVGRVRPGQFVEVHIDSLGQTLAGRVEAVFPVTAATFSLLPSRNTSGNFNKVSQLVPVKILLDDNYVPLIPGSSVEVKIYVTGPGEG